MSYELSCDNQSTMLDSAEGEAFQIILRVFRNHPDTGIELLYAAPGLNRNVEEVGGLEEIYDRGVLRGNRPFVGNPVYYRGNKDLNARLDALCNQFRTDPNGGRQSIATLKSAKDFDLLSRAAISTCQPLADEASGSARRMTLNESDEAIKISMALQIFPNGNNGQPLETEWIDFGFDILHSAAPGSGDDDRSKFEKRFVGQLALVDVGRAMEYIDIKTAEPLAQLRLLMTVMGFLNHKSLRAAR